MARPFGTELYEAFIAVAETQGFTTAATRLHRTQARVSQQIKRLEGLLERPLFSRTSRSVRLTPSGDALIPYARHILRLHDQAANAVTGATQEPLRLGVPDHYADTVLPGFIDVLRRDFDVSAPVVHCDQSIELFERFSSGELDIILTARYPNFPAGRTVSVEKLVWVGQRGFRPPPQRPLPLILYPDGCPFRARALASLRYAETAWEAVYTGQSGAALHAPLMLGLGVTPMSARTIPAGLQDVGARLGLPSINNAALDLHFSVPIMDQYGQHIEDVLAHAAEAALGDPCHA
jgi:DNA-binding transcriptional LysR family regulator